MSLNSLEKEGRSQCLTDFWIETKIEECLVYLVCNACVTLLTLLQQLQYNIPFNNGVLEYFGRALLLNLLAADEHVQELERNGENFDDLYLTRQTNCSDASTN